MVTTEENNANTNEIPDISIENIKVSDKINAFFKLYPDEFDDPVKRERFIWQVNKFKHAYERFRMVDVKQAVISMFEIADYAIAHLFNNITTKHSCKEGCSFCCHLDVTISQDEGLLIADYCNKNHIQIPGAYLINQQLHKKDTRGMSAISACVFLKNNKCSIYPVRPLHCRKHFVLTPASLCERAAKNKSSTGVTVTWAFIYKVEKLLCGLYNIDTLQWGQMPDMLLPYAK